MSIHLIIGNMRAGKSSELIRLAEKERLDGRKVILITYIGDDRYTDEHAIVTHTRRADKAIKCNSLADIDAKVIEEADVICIDEFQFLKESVEIVDKWANQGKRVYIAGLSGDYKRRPFPNISKVISLAETITKLDAICQKCGATAPFTSKPIDDGRGSSTDVVTLPTESVTNGEEEDIGVDQYLSVCRKCFHG